MQTVIKEYIRDTNNNPRGVCVAIKDGNQVHYGFSLHNPVDKYDKGHGIMVAIRRALSNGYKLPDVQDRYDAVVERFKSLEKRSLKYFKDVPEENVRIVIGDFLTDITNE